MVWDNVKLWGDQMESEERTEQLAFQLELLLEAVNLDEYPFTRELLRAGLSRRELDFFYQLLEDVRQQKNEQERDGLLSIEPLLVMFVGRLHPNLSPRSILEACVEQGIESDITVPLLRYVKLLD